MTRGGGASGGWGGGQAVCFWVCRLSFVICCMFRFTFNVFSREGVALGGATVYDEGGIFRGIFMGAAMFFGWGETSSSARQELYLSMSGTLPSEGKMSISSSPPRGVHERGGRLTRMRSGSTAIRDRPRAAAPLTDRARESCLCQGFWVDRGRRVWFPDRSGT